MMKSPQQHDAVPHMMWFTGTCTSVPPSHEQTLNINAGNTISMTSATNTGATRYIEKSHNGNRHIGFPPEELANSFKNFQAPPPPPPQPLLISPNNHESLLHTFQQWKPANNETLQSQQNDFEVCVHLLIL